MDCLTPEQTEAFARGDTDPAELALQRDHIAQCESCRHAVDEACANEAILRQLKRQNADGQRNAATAPLTPTETADDQSPSLDARRSMDALDTDSNIGRHIGPYEIKRQIGGGGMGNVYLAARVDDFKQTVALKLIKRGMDTDAILHRFRNERQVLAALKHPNVARLLDGGTTNDGLPYFVMEFVEGRPIDEYCDQHKLTTVERLRLFQQVCAAVHFAHQNTVIHRDLKPANILVSEDGLVKLVDFGIAKLTNRELAFQTLDYTAPEFRLMTPEYASPEQVRGDSLTTASDVYSLGVVLYELVTGHRPLRLASRALREIERVIAEQEPRRPSDVISEWVELPSASGDSSVLTPESVSLPREGQPDRLRKRLRGDIDNIVMMALAKEPRRRYASVEQFSADVEHYLRNEPVIAAPPSRTYRFRKFVHRNKGWIAAGSLATLALLAGLSLASYGFWRASQQRDRAIIAETIATNEAQRATAAEARATEQAERATRETRKVLAVNQFLTTMLSSVDPSISLGREITVREVLDQAAAHIEAGVFRDQPAIEAAIRHTIGSTYIALGRYDEAEPHLRRGLALCRELHGPESPEQSASIHALGCLLLYEGELAEAEDLFKEGLAQARQQFGDQSAQVALALNNLGGVLEAQGKYAEAEPILREVLALDRARGGEITTAANNLGVILQRLGKYDEAEQLYREVLAIHRAEHGNDHPTVASTLDNLALLLNRWRNDPEAEELMREALRINRKTCGDVHPNTARTLVNLADILLDQRRYDEAAALYREANQVDRAIYGDEHPLTASSMTGLAEVMSAQGNHAAARELFEKALVIQQKTLGPDHPDVAATLSALGSTLYALGEHEQAEAHFRQALELRRRTLGEDHPFVTASLGNLAASLAATGKPDEADALYQQVLRRQRQTLGKEHQQVGVTLLNYSTMLSSQGRHADAADAARQALEIFVATHGEQHLRVAEARQQLAKVLQAGGEFEAAETELLTAYNLRATLAGSDARATQESALGLVDLYEAWGKPDAAAEWRVKASTEELEPE
ncbi:MAG: serine/threonine protein kinase [Phycisphaerae bacterium]|nr:serine/threonine protein kinase [Phycisphaerae bacterium]